MKYSFVFFHGFLSFNSVRIDLRLAFIRFLCLSALGCYNFLFKDILGLQGELAPTCGWCHVSSRVVFFFFFFFFLFKDVEKKNGAKKPQTPHP